MIKRNNIYEVQFQKITGFEFIKFYNEYKPRLTWYLTKYTRDIAIAEDWAQEAFMQALNKIDTYDLEKGAQVHTWVYTIAENLVKNDFKIKQRLPSLSLDKEISENFKLINCIPYEEAFVEGQKTTELEQKAEIIKHVISKLDDKFKRILIMRELDEMSYKNIAKELSMNLSTVKSRIKKGRKLVIQKVQSKFKQIDDHGI